MAEDFYENLDKNLDMIPYDDPDLLKIEEIMKEIKKLENNEN